MSNWRVVNTAPQGSSEWLTTRASGIGGSDIGALLGYSRFRSAIDVWLDKTGRGEPVPVNAAMHWGNLLEPVVRDHYRALHPRAWVDEVPGVIGHPDIPIALASLDGFVVDKDGERGLEIKTTGQFWTDLPPAYKAQVAWYMAVTGIEVFDVAILSRGQTYGEVTVERDPELCDDMLAFATTWWDAYVVTDTRPPLELAEQRPQLIDKLWPGKQDLEVTVTQSVADGLRAAKADVDNAAAVLEERTLAVKSLMQDATIARDENGDVLAKWSEASVTRRVDTQALKDAGLYDEYAKPGRPSRRFTIVAGDPQ